MARIAPISRIGTSTVGSPRRGIWGAGLFILALLCFAPAGRAQTVLTATDAASLIAAINTIDGNPTGGPYAIDITQNITLSGSTVLPPILAVNPSTVTINGGGNTLDGGGVTHGFLVDTGTIALDNLTIRNTVAQGGAGAGTAAVVMAPGTTLGFVSGAAVNLGNDIMIAGDPTIMTTPGTPATDSSVITGNGSIDVDGGGIVTLSGANTYTGGTKICGTNCGAAGGDSVVIVTNSNPGTSSSIGTGPLTFDGGTLEAGANGLSFSNSVFINSTGGTVDSNGNTLTLSGLIQNGSGSPGTLTIANSGGAGGTVVLTNDNNLFNGATVVGSGTLALSGGGSLAQSSGVTVATGATFDISGNGPGATSIKSLSGAGTVQTGSGTSSGLNLTNASGNFSGVIAGNGGVALTGGNETLSGANTYTGGTTLTAGTLQAGVATVGTPGAITSSAIGTGTLTFNGGTLRAGLGSLTIANNAAINTTGGTIDANGDNLTYSGVIANGNGTTGTMTIVNSGGAGGAVTLTGANTYSGGTTIGSGATLALSGTGSISGSSGVADTGTFDISQTTSGSTIATLSGSGAVALGGEALTISNGSTSFSGVIADGGIGGGRLGSLVVNGGTQTLTGVNTYTGATTITAGTLAIGAGGSIATSGQVNLAGPTAVFSIGGAGNQTIQDLIGVAGSTVDLGTGTDTLTAGTGNSTTFAGALTDAGSFVKQGSGTLTLTGASTFTGTTSITGGTLAIGAGGSIASSSQVGLAGGTIFDISAGGSQTIQDLQGIAGSEINLGGNALTLGTSNNSSYGGQVVGTGGSLIKTGAGTLLLYGSNTYTGGTTVNAGTLAGNGTQAFGTGTLTLGDGTTLQAAAAGLSGVTLAVSNNITLGGATTFDSQSGTLTTSGVISGPGSLTKIGSGTLTLSSNDTYNGATTVDAGTLALSGAGSIGQSAVNLAGSGTTLDVSAASAPAIGGLSGVGGSTVTLPGNGNPLAINQTGTSIFGGSFIGNNSSSVLLQGGGIEVLTGTNTNMAGSFDIDSGTLSIGAGGSIANAVGGVILDGGPASTFDISGGGDQTVQNLTGLGTGSVTLGANTLTVINTRANTLPAIISGTGGLVVEAPGSSLTLSGANTYTGPTTVAAGATLYIGNGGSIASSGSLTIDDGGTFDISTQGGGNQTVNNLSGTNAAIVLGPYNLTENSTGDTTYDGTITGSATTSGLTKTGAAALTLTRGVAYSGPTTIEGGTLALGSAGSLSPSSEVNLAASGATLDVSGALSPTTIQDLVGVAGTTVALGTTGLNVGTANSTTFAGVFTGSGALAKQGSGTLTLAGNSTGFTGPTTVDAGILALSGAGAIGQSAINLAGGTTLDVSAATSPATGGLTGVVGSTVNLAGAALTIDQTGTSTFAGSLVGNNSSSVLLQGGGIEVLTGTNTNMTGSFVIDSGTLSIGAGGSIANAVGGVVINGGGSVFDISNGGDQTVLNLGGSGTGSVTLGANTLTVMNTAANTLPAIISGTGGLVIGTSSSLTLSGANSYTGPTTVSGGATLYMGPGGSIASSSSLTISGGGTFDIGTQGGGNQTVNNLSGTNAAVVLGPYSLTENSTVDTTYDGTITGSTPTSGLVKAGAATLTLTRGVGYIGPTTIVGGTLALGPAGSLSSSSAVNLAASGATLDLSGAVSPATIQGLAGVAGTTVALGTVGLNVGAASSTVFAGTFTGSGALTKQGTGTLTLDGNNSGFAGSTTIAAGTLEVGDINNPGAALGGDVTVDPGGTLAGHGSVLGNVTNMAGTLSPGGTIGTMSLAGNYTQGSAGTLSIEVSPSAASQLKVGGAASLNGKLALVFDPGIYSTTSYKILTASSITGKFSTVTGTNPTGLAQALLYDPADVTLQLTGTAEPTVVAPTIVAPTNDTIFSAVASTAILTAQQVNGIILDRLGGRVAGIVDGQVAAGSAGPATVQVAQNGPAGPLGDIAAALPAALGSQGAWFRGVGGFASVNGNSTAPGFTGSTGGFLAGYDRPVGPNVYLGVAGGYLHSGINEHSTSTGSEDSARFSVYGGMMVGADLLSGTAGYAHDWFNTQRGFAGIGTATANNGGDEVTAAGQWSRAVGIAGLNGGTATLTPKAGLQYLHLSTGAFSEFGAGGLDLSSGGKGTDSLQPFVQVALSQKFTSETGTVVAPELRLGYAYEVFDSRLLTVTTASGTAFPVTGVAPSRNQLSAGVGLVMEAAPTLSVYADYDTILHTGNTTEQTVQAGLRWKF